MTPAIRISLFCILYLAILSFSNHEADAVEKTTKNPLLMSDFDIEKILDQWEDNDEDKLPDDELPPHKRPPMPKPKLDESIFEDREKFMKMSKKGSTLMTFVTVAGNPTRLETERLTERWQVALTNAHLRCQRYIVADDRAIFLFEDGSLAYEAKEFLLDQPELKDYSIDNQVFHGKGYPVEYPNIEKGEKSHQEL